MTDKEKLELLLNSVFSDISFAKIQTLENGSFHLSIAHLRCGFESMTTLRKSHFGKILNLSSNELDFQRYLELIRGQKLKSF